MPSESKLQEILLKIRKCYKCNRLMHWHDFALGNLRALPENYFEHEVLLEIWVNPIFIIHCCWCFNRKHFTNFEAN